MLWDPGAERNYVNLSFHYCFVIMTLLLWFLLPRLTQVNTGISRGDGGPVLTPLLPGSASSTCWFNDPRFLRQGEECGLHAVCSSFHHAFTARDAMWDLQMPNNLSLHQRKQKTPTICNANLFVLKQCRAMQRQTAAGSAGLTLHTGLLVEKRDGAS